MSSVSPRPEPARLPPSRCRSFKARPPPEESAGLGSRTHARARAPGVRGLRTLRVAPQGRPRAARVRRPGLRHAAVRAEARRARRGRNPGPHHGPPGEGHAGPLRAEVPGARRGRRDAQDGLRGGRRDDPRPDPRGQAGRAVLRHDAGPDPPPVGEVPQRPQEITVKQKTTTSVNLTQRYLVVSLPAEGRRPHPHPRGRELRGDDRLHPHQERDGDARGEAARSRLCGGRHQWRRGAGPARTHRQAAARRQARHPGRDRRRSPRPRRRPHQPRRELRHPRRHRVLRAPRRPHRPGRPHGRRHQLRDAARAAAADLHRTRHPPAADPDAPAER